MEYKNGYKVVYEVAADGERTFYASKSNEYPPRDEDGKIVENEMNTKLAAFKDADFAGMTIYEHEGEFYYAKANEAKLDEERKPLGTKIKGFEKILVEDVKPTEEPTPVNEPANEPANEPENTPENNNTVGEE